MPAASTRTRPSSRRSPPRPRAIARSSSRSVSVRDTDLGNLAALRRELGPEAADRGRRQPGLGSRRGDLDGRRTGGIPAALARGADRRRQPHRRLAAARRGLPVPLAAGENLRGDRAVRSGARRRRAGGRPARRRRNGAASPAACRLPGGSWPPVGATARTGSAAASGCSPRRISWPRPAATACSRSTAIPIRCAKVLRDLIRHLKTGSWCSAMRQVWASSRMPRWSASRFRWAGRPWNRRDARRAQP